MLEQIISHYRVLEQIGGGGRGGVYRAEDTKLHRSVALKFLPDELTKDRTALKRFQREAQAASALNHPNICTIYDLDEHDGQPFIVMELMTGHTLKEKLARGPLKTDEVLELGIQLADALDTAHEAGIIHRDVKPANVFIMERGQAKLLDFGLAKVSASARDTDDEDLAALVSKRLTADGSPVGAFDSNEQAIGQEVDRRTDLFSLGAILYEAATGKPASAGATSAAIFDEILHKEPLAAVELDPTIPVELGFVISKLLEQQPDLCYPSAAELRTDLKRIQRHSDSSHGAEAATEDTEYGRWKVLLSGLGLLALAAVVYVLVFGPAAGPRFSDLDPKQAHNQSANGQVARIKFEA